MADDPFKLRVLKALTAGLKEITPDNGYVNDVSQAVFRGRLVFGDKDPLPMLSILEVPIPLEQMRSPETSTLSAGDWELMVQGFVQDDYKNPTDPAHVLLADVTQRLSLMRREAMQGDDILGFKGAISDMVIGRGVVRPPDAEVSAKAYFWLSLTLKVVEDLAEPYADA
jgi:hypothetical protein